MRIYANYILALFLIMRCPFPKMDDTLLFANDVLSGRIPTLATAEKAKGAQYPKPVWQSRLGGVNEEKAKARGLRNFKII